MRGLNCRGLRLELVAALGMAFAGPALAVAASGISVEGSQPEVAQRTATSLSAQTRVQNGHTVGLLAVTVKGDDGLAPTGAVVIEEDGKDLAGAALSADGHARLAVTLPSGEHNLTALYMGDATHQASVSPVSGVRAQASSATPDFQLSISPASLSLTAGQSGTATASLTPINANALTAPMFVTLACSGFPDQSSCTFTPENVEILPNATTPIASSMVLTTQARSLTGNSKLELAQQPTRRLGSAASGNPGISGAGVFGSPKALAQQAVAAGAGRIGHCAGSYGLQSALLLLQPRASLQPAHPGRLLHFADHGAIEQRHYRDHAYHPVCADSEVTAPRQIGAAILSGRGPDLPGNVASP